CQQDYIPPYTF
nr:immunoglobulin light chain junction region [Macaca mulatta]MOX23592.1 immunoglobulin light chain junction region [Macaca mulatta]MOX23634.1 immunoglobulin light chain junction region [Macaca mulatta]MOX24687.1 immunoglobulin light chain junction region [Macaca mulatta]MOX24757.1 immunoglobulin light chain junction region [Macaca mulatta]